eukprot:Skav214469  [mRNA]  locus=scaffold1167:121481:126031:+ [translate_table: standard]
MSCSQALPVAAISTVMSFFLGKLSGSDSGLSADDLIKVQREKQKTTRETRKTAEAQRKASDARTKELTKESEAKAKESQAKAKESEAKAKELEIMLQESKASRELENAKQETIKKHNQEVVLESGVSVVKAGAMALIGRKVLIEWQKFVDFQREQKKQKEIDELELEQKSEMFQMTQKHVSQTHWCQAQGSRVRPLRHPDLPVLASENIAAGYVCIRKPGHLVSSGSRYLEDGRDWRKLTWHAEWDGVP